MDKNKKDKEKEEQVISPQELKQQHLQEIVEAKRKLLEIEFEENKDQMLMDLPEWQQGVERVMESYAESIKLCYQQLGEVKQQLAEISIKKK